jgi:hypothetical protein
MTSAFREALAAGGQAELVICPGCGATDLPRSSSGAMPTPTLERRQDGVYFCTICSKDWTPKKETHA